MHPRERERDRERRSRSPHRRNSPSHALPASGLGGGGRGWVRGESRYTYFRSRSTWCWSSEFSKFPRSCWKPVGRLTPPGTHLRPSAIRTAGVHRSCAPRRNCTTSLSLSLSLSLAFFLSPSRRVRASRAGNYCTPFYLQLDSTRPEFSAECG